MQNTDDALLPPGPFNRSQAEAVVATYLNVTVLDDQGTHFRLIIRDLEGQLTWRAWDFEAQAGAWLNRYLSGHGISRS